MQGWLRLVRVWLGEGGTGTECAHRWPGADRRGPSSSRGRSVAVRGVSAVKRVRSVVTSAKRSRTWRYSFRACFRHSAV